jgi:predicted enzyme related to lactoylglutathione lyase
MLANAQPEAVIPVSDLERGISFYGDTVGLTLLERYDVPAEAPAARFQLGGGTITVYKSVGAGQSRHTVAAIVVDDIDAAVDELRSRGITFEEYDMGDIKTENGVVRMGKVAGAWFKDPDGNIIGLGSYSD